MHPPGASTRSQQVPIASSSLSVLAAEFEEPLDIREKETAVVVRRHLGSTRTARCGQHLLPFAPQLERQRRTSISRSDAMDENALKQRIHAGRGVHPVSGVPPRCREPADHPLLEQRAVQARSSGCEVFSHSLRRRKEGQARRIAELPSRGDGRASRGARCLLRLRRAVSD